VTPSSADWVCGTCGSAHSGLAFGFGFDAPVWWSAASEDDRAKGALNADTCVLPVGEELHYFVRGALELPLRDLPGEVFTWNVWASLSPASWELTTAHWDDPARVELEPMFGWLSNSLPYGIETTNLAVRVHTRAPGTIPAIEVDPSSEHPLAKEQLNGITLHRVDRYNKIAGA